MSPINYKIRGKGLPVILIHGFCETGEIWDTLAKSLVDHFQVITIDLPGFGKSPLTKGNFTLDEVGLLLNGWVAEQGFKNPILLGHSLGGYVTLAMVKQNSELYAGFGLIHSTARPDNDLKKVNRDKVIEFVHEHGVKPFVNSFVPSLYYTKDHPSMDFVHKIASSTSEVTFLSYTAAMRDRPSSEEVIRKSTIPVLIVAGQNDTVVESESLAEQARLNDQVIFHNLAHVGHMGMFEAEPELTSVIIEFVSRVTKPGAE